MFGKARATPGSPGQPNLRGGQLSARLDTRPQSPQPRCSCAAAFVDRVRRDTPGETSTAPLQCTAAVPALNGV
eukprot:365242-Chlamydomonas_euryale.AAC.2